MLSIIRLSPAIVATALLFATMPAAAQRISDTKPPETFIARAQVVGQEAGSTASVTIHITEYTSDRDRKTLEDALKIGGYPGFLPALRKARDVGYIELNGRRTALRWARQQAKAPSGRTISVIGESPIFFVGGGAPDAKPRAGFELSVVLLNVDSIGLGSGSMAPAARVKPGGETGVQVEDYGAQMVKLVTVSKELR